MNEQKSAVYSFQRCVFIAAVFQSSKPFKRQKVSAAECCNRNGAPRFPVFGVSKPKFVIRIERLVNQHCTSTSASIVVSSVAHVKTPASWTYLATRTFQSYTISCHGFSQFVWLGVLTTDRSNRRKLTPIEMHEKHHHSSSSSSSSSSWSLQKTWDTKLEMFCRYEALGNWKRVARNAVQWDALLQTFLHFCSMHTLLPRFLRDAWKLYSIGIYWYVNTYIFSFPPPPLHRARLRALGLTWVDLSKKVFLQSCSSVQKPDVTIMIWSRTPARIQYSCDTFLGSLPMRYVAQHL